MTSKTPVKVDLNKHALERLLERQPMFVTYTPDDSTTVIEILNRSYKSGTIYKRLHGNFSNYVLEVLDLCGIFYLEKHVKLPDTYTASTFKFFRKPLVGNGSPRDAQVVSVEYSFNVYNSKK